MGHGADDFLRNNSAAELSILFSEAQVFISPLALLEKEDLDINKIDDYFKELFFCENNVLLESFFQKLKKRFKISLPLLRRRYQEIRSKWRSDFPYREVSSNKNDIIFNPTNEDSYCLILNIKEMLIDNPLIFINGSKDTLIYINSSKSAFRLITNEKILSSILEFEHPLRIETVRKSGDGEITTTLKSKPYDEKHLRAFLSYLNGSGEGFRVLDFFSDGPIFKNNVILTKEGFDLESILYLLDKRKENHYAYAVWRDGFIDFGITPEFLYKKDKNEISLMALAGTAKDPRKLQEMKEQDEFNFVENDLHSKLNHLSDSIDIKKGIVEYKGFYHLMSEFKGSYDGNEDLVSHFSPTPALCGTPTQAALSALAELDSYCWEQDERKFGSPLLFSFNNKETAIIRIRNAHFENNVISLYSGLGVTKDSHLESEYEELLMKRASVEEYLFG